MYSFSVHGKHLRNPTTSSILGPIELSAKIFTVCIAEVEILRIIFCTTTEHGSRILVKNDTGKLGEHQEHRTCIKRNCFTLTVMDPITCLEQNHRSSPAMPILEPSRLGSARGISSQCAKRDTSAGLVSASLPIWT